MNTPIADLTALLSLFRDLTSGDQKSDGQIVGVLQQIGQAVVDYVAMEEADRAQELADKPKEEAAHAAKLAALQAIPGAIGALAAELRALADRPLPAQPPVPSSAPQWRTLQVNVTSDGMGRMQSFTIEKAA